MRIFLLLLWVTQPILAQGISFAPVPHAAAMDRDLMDVTVERLETLYREHRYTVTQVVQWHLDRYRQ
jgi:amidase